MKKQVGFHCAISPHPLLIEGMGTGAKGKSSQNPDSFSAISNSPDRASGRS